MSATVRRAQPEDAAAVVALMDEAARWLMATATTRWRPGQVDEPRVHSWMASGRLYVAEEDGRVVGTVRLAWSDEPVWGPRPPDAGYVHSLVVARAAAGRALGRTLLAHAERVVHDSGRPLVRLDHVDGNPRLEQWYTEAGYALVGRHEQDGGDVVLLREKRIGALS